MTPDEPEPCVRRPAATAGAVALIVGLAITGTLAVRNGWDSFIDHDAVYFHSVAQDLDGSEAAAGSAAYRYGRIALPVLARGLSFGAPGLLAAGQTLVTPLAFAVVVTAAVATAAKVSGRWRDGLAVLVVPGLWIGFMNAWADTLLAACVVASIWATVEARRWVAVGAVALAALTKEIGVLAAIPVIAAAGGAKQWRWVVAGLGALGPVALWWTWIRVQAGEWPFLADDPSRARAISPPLADIVAALTGGRGSPMAALYALAVGGLGLLVLARRPTHPLGWSAGVWGVLTLCLGDNVLAYPGDTLRVTTPAACVVALAVAVLLRDSPSSSWVARASVRPT